MKDILISLFIFCVVMFIAHSCESDTAHTNHDGCKYRAVSIGVQYDGAEAYHFNSYGKLPDGGIYFNSVHDDNQPIEIHGSYTLEQWHD